MNDDNFISNYEIPKDKINKYDVKDTSIVYGTYQIKYLGNNKFSDLKIIYITNYKNFVDQMKSSQQ
jgi:hypothetical protein